MKQIFIVLPSKFEVFLHLFEFLVILHPHLSFLACKWPHGPRLGGEAAVRLSAVNSKQPLVIKLRDTGKYVTTFTP